MTTTPWRWQLLQAAAVSVSSLLILNMCGNFSFLQNSPKCPCGRALLVSLSVLFLLKVVGNWIVLPNTQSTWTLLMQMPSMQLACSLKRYGSCFAVRQLTR